MKNINEQIELAHVFLKETNVLFVTFGTARVYNQGVTRFQNTNRLTYTLNNNTNHRLQIDAIHEQQLAAQSKLNEGNVGDAMGDYEALIKKGQRLDEIIEDLNLAAEKYPEEISIVQTLGDAYMQANRLQEALDAYTKAGELLK